MMKKHLIIVVNYILFIFVSTLVTPIFANSDTESSKMLELAKDLGTVDKEVNANKRKLVEKYMKLTDEEAETFWPVYNAYQNDLYKITKRQSKAIGIYAQAYKKDTLSNETAERLLDEFLAIKLAEAKLKQLYIPKLKKVLPIVKAARYIQFETKIQAVIDFSLANKIPLVK